MKPKIKKGLLITVVILTILFFYGRHNFQTDKQELIRIKVLALNADSKTIFKELKQEKNFTNPLISFAYKRWEKGMYSRFVNKDEVYENTSKNQVVYSLSNIYRNYYADEFLKEDLNDRNSDELYEKLSEYLYYNKLTQFDKDSLKIGSNIENEIARILKNDNFEYKFLHRNGIQELLIWNDITTENYEVVLPNDTINTTVIFINSFHLEDFDSFVTYGSASVGGWAIEENATLYCNRTGYSLLSNEDFIFSYLKHETLHFKDLNDYPNLSSADLEYRSKLIELMYLTDWLKENVSFRIYKDFRVI